MATNTSAELDALDCNFGENGLDEFDPEPPRPRSWLRAGGLPDPVTTATTTPDDPERRTVTCARIDPPAADSRGRSAEVLRELQAGVWNALHDARIARGW